MIAQPHTLKTLFEAAVRAESRSHVFAKWYENKVWQQRTYAETLDRVRTLSEWFGQHGLRPGDSRVAIILPNSPSWVEVYLAIVGINGTVVPVDPKLTPQELHHILADAEVSMLVTDATHLKTVANLISVLPNLQRILLTEEASLPADVNVPIETIEAALASVSPSEPLRFWDDASYQPSPDSICGILYTSGTTGKPKGAMLSHKNFITDAYGALQIIKVEVTSRDSFLMVLPLFHAFCFTANFLIAVIAHAQMHYVRSLRTVAEDMRYLNPTVLMAVPLLAEKLVTKLVAKARETWVGRVLCCTLPKVVGCKMLEGLGGKLRLIIVGGAKCDPMLLRQLNRFGIPASEGYGLTECAPIISLNSPAHGKIGSVGPVIAGLEARIAKPDAQGVGELQVRGPQVFRGYWKRPEATEETFQGDWLCTGDLASMDDAGFITIRGRAKALIVNREGKNIYPEEVEQAIARDPLIGDVVVIAYHGKDEPGERVGAIVSPNEAYVSRVYATLTPEQLTERLRDAVKHQCESLAAYKHPRKVLVSLTPLERTSTQKVRRGVYAGALDD
jgi:long-chain acyl-CoA synthetase